VRSGQVCVAAEGELDLSTADELKQALLRELAGGRRVLLDLSDVTFIDSSGLAAIVSALHATGNGNGGKLELSGGLRPQARRLMELTGVLSLLSVDGAPEPLDAG
jgi:anti-sigma B factor antagonist